MTIWLLPRAKWKPNELSGNLIHILLILLRYIRAHISLPELNLFFTFFFCFFPFAADLSFGTCGSFFLAVLSCDPFFFGRDTAALELCGVLTVCSDPADFALDPLVLAAWAFECFLPGPAGFRFPSLCFTQPLGDPGFLHLGLLEDAWDISVVLRAVLGDLVARSSLSSSGTVSVKRHLKGHLSIFCFNQKFLFYQSSTCGRSLPLASLTLPFHQRKGFLHWNKLPLVEAYGDPVMFSRQDINKGG